MNLEHVKSAKILVVDDDSVNLKMLFDYLTKFDFVVFVAQDGSGAFRLMETESPDMILLDVRMPDIDGFEVCRRLKSHDATKDIPVIFMTALSNTGDKLKGFDAGGVDYITKPIQYRELLARVAAHLTVYKLQQQLQEQNRQLQELNASKDTFFSIISHDLRSPFNVLLALTKIIDEQFDTHSKEKLRKHVKKLRVSAERLYALLENLLTWSRVQRGAMEYHPEQIHIGKIVTHNVNLFTHNAEQKRIQLLPSVEEKICAYADYSMVDTVIRNLTSNALKFTPAGGTIKLSATQDESEIEVCVSDTGSGIPEEHLHKLLRLDAKYTQTGTAGETGTGLGLVLCQELLERNGGKIRIESEVGKGSTFRFTLPRSEGSRQ